MRLKLANISPASTVTVVGTVSSLVSLESSVTTRFVGSVPDSITVPALINTPSFSQACATLSSRSNCAGSLSRTVMLSRPVVQFVTLAVRVTNCAPSISDSSITLIEKTTDVAPEGITTDAGT